MMRSSSRSALLVFGLLAGCSPHHLDAPTASLGVRVPEQTAPRLTVQVLDTGGIQSLRAFLVEGGSLSPTETTIAAILVRHPKATFLIDAGFGKNVDRHFKTTPPLMQKLARIRRRKPITAQLSDCGLSVDDLWGVVLTHGHWDHVSGLEDLPRIQVVLSARELRFIESGSDDTRLIQPWIPALNFTPVVLDGPPFLGFPRSLDLFGDGAVVLVPLWGHTPGTLGVFLRLGSRRGALIISDTSWTNEGVAWPAPKPEISKEADFDPEGVARLLIHLHRLQRENPGLLIVPSHDKRALDALAAWAAEP